MKRSPASRRRQRGAAILLAMLIMTLVATLAAGMIWTQWRGIEVESAERARGEGDWLLTGALDWARLILRSDTNIQRDDLGEPWAVPLAESRLSSFLSADGNHTDDSGPDAFLSGQITDAQSKYNFYNLYNDQTATQEEDKNFEILCTAIGLPASVAQTISKNLRQSATALKAGSSTQDSTNSYLMPDRVQDLAWYGIDPATVKQLEPYVVFLPTATPVNANTAPAEVLMAAIPGLSRSQAQLIIQKRQSSPFTTYGDVQNLIPAAQTNLTVSGDRIGGASSFYEVYGQLRYEQHILRQRTLVRRTGKNIVEIRSERLPPTDP